jgi:hypothetical protein
MTMNPHTFVLAAFFKLKFSFDSMAPAVEVTTKSTVKFETLNPYLASALVCWGSLWGVNEADRMWGCSGVRMASMSTCGGGGGGG